jgi:hypothetical protein
MGCEGLLLMETPMRQQDLFKLPRKPWNAGRLVGPMTERRPACWPRGSKKACRANASGSCWRPRGGGDRPQDFRLFVYAGLSGQDIALRLNTEEVLAPNGGDWTRSAVDRILRQEGYAGAMTCEA